MVKFIQKGFTLVELMIVVAIIGILAAVAIPAYSDYTARAQVSEAVQISSSFRTGLSEYYQNKSVWPFNLTAVGSTTAGKYVASVAITTGGGGTGDLVMTAIFNTTNVSPLISASTYGLATADGGNTWQCGQNGALSTAVTTVESKHLPGACK